MRRGSGRQTLRASEGGIAAVEFAMVAPVMLLMLMGFFDLGHQYYATSILQGAMQKAARDSTLESGPGRAAAIDQAVEDALVPVVGDQADFDPERLSYTAFSDVGKPEIFIDKEPKNGSYDIGECFEDVNGNGQWDDDLGKEGQGSAHDAVLYRMTVTYSRLFPVGKLVGAGDQVTISASTVLRNQPYGEQEVPTVVKCT